MSANAPALTSVSQSSIPNIESRLGESVLLKCGHHEHSLLKQLESTVPSMPVLVNWYKHYSLTRRSDKPIYAKYLANNIDYAPHISRDYENRLQVVDKINLNISNVKAVDEALYECRLILFDKAYADSQTGSMFYLQVYGKTQLKFIMNLYIKVIINFICFKLHLSLNIQTKKLFILSQMYQFDCTATLRESRRLQLVGIKMAKKSKPTHQCKFYSL